MMGAMKIIYTMDEVRDNLSEILEAVSAGESITIIDGDVPVAEIRPLPEERRKPYPKNDDKLEQHLEEMRRRGVLQRGYGPRGDFKPIARVPGALERFLKERG